MKWNPRFGFAPSPLWGEGWGEGQLSGLLSGDHRAFDHPVVTQHDERKQQFIQVARLSSLARQQGRGLRYLAQLDRDGKARVRLVTPDATHASLHSQLTDNLIQFRTRRYAANPLVVQGPGAGRDVTAAGVFGDILSIAQTLGARA